MHKAVLLSLVGTAVAQLSASCIDITFDAATNVLSAGCEPRDHSDYVTSDLDLDDCFGYDGVNITPNGSDFGSSCTDCHHYEAPDPWYGTNVYWISCSCTGQSEEVSVPLEVAAAHQYVVNTDGVLTCPGSS